MLNYIPFYTHIWSDKKFNKLSISARFMFIYLFANDSISLTGIYELDLDVCKLKIKLNGDFEKTFKEVIESGLIRWDETTDIIFIINRFKLIPNKSPKVIQGAINELNIINHPFKEEFLKIYGKMEYFKFYKPNLKDFDHSEVDLLNEEQILGLAKLGWHKQRLKKFFLDRNYSEQKIDEVINSFLPNLK